MRFANTDPTFLDAPDNFLPVKTEPEKYKINNLLNSSGVAKEKINKFCLNPWQWQKLIKQAWYVSFVQLNKCVWRIQEIRKLGMFEFDLKIKSEHVASNLC